MKTVRPHTQISPVPSSSWFTSFARQPGNTLPELGWGPGGLVRGGWFLQPRVRPLRARDPQSLCFH